MLVAPALDQNIEHIALLIYRSPQIVGLPVDFEKDLIQMPLVSSLAMTAFQFIGVCLPKLLARIGALFRRSTRFLAQP